MAILTFRAYAELPEAERLRRIGELLATAVFRWEHDQRVTVSAANRGDTRTTESRVLNADPIETDIVRHLTRVSAATPRDLCLALGLARMTVARKLARLRAAGVLTASGKTRAVCYRLRSDPSAN